MDNSPSIDATQSGSKRLKTGDVHVRIERIDIDGVPFEEARALLSPEERARAERFVRKGDHDRFVRSHACLRLLLQGYAGMRAGELRFAVNRFGKPMLVKEPDGRLPVNFNLSHAGDLLIVAVTEARVGVDLEKIRPEAATAEVAGRFLTRWEQDQLETLDPPERIRAFFNGWTRKEAYLKAIGCGLSGDPLRCEVALRPEDSPSIRRILSAPDGTGQWHVFHLEPAPDYIAAVVVDHPEPVLSLS